MALKMSVLTRIFWKSIPQNERQLILNCIPEVNRRVLNRVMSNRTGFPQSFDKNKFIFIHVPKAAGSSLKAALDLSFRDAGHLPLTYYEHLYPQKYQEFYKFAFVRNPWSRLLSAYNYMSRRTEPDDMVWAESIAKLGSFEKFVMLWLSEETIGLDDVFVPQYRFLINSCGVVSMDFIGKFEALSTDFSVIQQHIGSQTKIPKINTGIKADYRQMFTTKMVDKVFKIYERDVLEFGYDF